MPSRVAAIATMIEPEGPSTVGSGSVRGCSRDLKGGPVASPNGKSRVSDPCARPSESTLMGWSRVASATRTCMFFRVAAGKTSRVNQDIASFALFDAVVFQHPGLSSGVIEDGFFAHAHQSAPASHFRWKRSPWLTRPRIFPRSVHLPAGAFRLP